MHGSLAGEVVDLMAARRAGGDDDGVSLLASYRWKEFAFTDGTRHLVMVVCVSERSRHAAAAGVDVDDGDAGNARQHRFGGREESHRLLVAVAVEQNRARTVG